MKPGDKVTCEIQHIGKLDVEIIADPSSAKCYANNVPSKL